MQIESTKESKVIQNLLEIFNKEFSPSLSNSIQDFHAYAQKIADNGDVFISYNGHIVQGFCAFYSNQPPQAYISLIVVKSQSHGQGVGTALLSACEQYAHSKGCLNMKLAVDIWNSKAIAFYEYNGYRKMSERSQTQWFYQKVL